MECFETCQTEGNPQNMIIKEEQQKRMSLLLHIEKMEGCLPQEGLGEKKIGAGAGEGRKSDPEDEVMVAGNCLE